MNRKSSICIVLVALLLSLATKSIQAQTTTDWSQTTAGSYNWSTGGSWNGGSAPNGSLSTARFNGTGFQLSGTYGITQDVVGLTLAGITINSIAATTADLTISGGSISLNNTNSTDRAFINRTGNDTLTPKLVINSNLTLDDVNGVNFISSTAASGSITVNGNISGSGKLFLNGMTFLGGSNSFSGGIEFANGRLIATNTAALASVTGTLQWNNGGLPSVGISTLAAGTTTVNNALNFGTGSQTISLNAAGAGTLLDITTSDITNGIGIGAISIVKENNTNGVVIPAGTGTTRFSGTNFTVSRNVAGGQFASVELSPSTGVQTWSGNLTGFFRESRVIKSGNGTVKLTGQNTYAAQTQVNAGTLVINGTHSQIAGGQYLLDGYNSTTNGNYRVASGGILGGTGRISGNDGNTANSNMILVQSNGILAPGDGGIGALTLDGINIGGTNSRVLNLASGAKMAFDLSGSGGAPDQLNMWNYLAGDMALNSNVVDFSLVGAVVGGNYAVSLVNFYSNNGLTLTASGIGSGLDVGTLGANISSASFVYNTNSIDLQYTVVPEPTAGALLGVAMGAGLFFRRRLAR